MDWGLELFEAAFEEGCIVTSRDPGAEGFIPRRNLLLPVYVQTHHERSGGPHDPAGEVPARPAR